MPPKRTETKEILRGLAYSGAQKRPVENQTDEQKVNTPAGLLLPPSSSGAPIDTIASATSKHYDIFRDHTMSPDDIPFDIWAVSPLLLITPAILPAAVGGTYTWYNYLVPPGQRMVFNQLAFFGLINNAPVIPYPIPCGYFEMTGAFDFHIHVNGRSPINAYWQAATPAGPIAADGHPCTTEHPAELGPNYGGLRFQARGGERITLFIRRYQLGALPRPLLCYGARMTGFITADKDPRLSK